MKSRADRDKKRNEKGIFVWVAITDTGNG